MRDRLALVQQLREVVGDERVLAALATVPREQFVRFLDHGRAYENVALPIDCGQTISQPLVVARMLELLAPSPDDRVLDVGTGSGYHAALLALLCRHVFTVERHAELSGRAAEAIGRLGLDNVTFVVGDGAEGIAEQAPFDAINVAAAIGDGVPPALEDQLALGGRLVAPLGDEAGQHLTLITRDDGGLHRRRLEPVRFVPLVRER